MNIPHFDVVWNSYEIHTWNPEIREGLIYKGQHYLMYQVSSTYLEV